MFASAGSYSLYDSDDKHFERMIHNMNLTYHVFADIVIATNSGKTLDIVALIRTDAFTGYLASAGWPARSSHVPFLSKLHKIPPRSA